MIWLNNNSAIFGDNPSHHTLFGCYYVLYFKDGTAVLTFYRGCDKKKPETLTNMGQQYNFRNINYLTRAHKRKQWREFFKGIFMKKRSN